MRHSSGKPHAPAPEPVEEPYRGAYGADTAYAGGKGSHIRTDSGAELGAGSNAGSNADPDAGFDDDGEPERKKMARWKKVVIAIIVILALIIVSTAVALLFYTRQLQSNVKTIEDPFPKEENVEAPRPQKKANDAVNILVIGSDARLATTQNGVVSQRGNRSDALMLVQLREDRKGANVMSIPRDSWVDIPGHGKGKINWAYSFGGAPLAIQTVEQLTGVRIDHVVMADFNSFKTLTDKLGGVELITSSGVHNLNGEQALRFVRERKSLPGGDFDRVRRQQAWMMAIAKKTLSKEVLTSPTKLNDLLQTVTSSIATDPDFTVTEMGKLGLSMRDASIVNIHMMTAPNKGSGMAGDQSVVWLDDDNFGKLSKAWADDRVEEWIENNPDSVQTLDKGAIH